MTKPTIFTDPDTRFTVIETRQGNSVTFTDGWSLGWPEDRPGQPGDDVAITRSGHWVRGVAINDQVIFYRTEDEDTAHRRAEIEAKDRTDRIEFYLPEDMAPYLVWRGKYHALPEVFQRRIQKFVGERDDWIRRFGAYEMSACVDAVRVGKWFKENGATEEDYARWTGPVADAPFELSDSHSGNSYGFAIRLGYWYATDPEMVVLEHGALTPLVGCDEYGCPHPDDPDI